MKENQAKLPGCSKIFGVHGERRESDFHIFFYPTGVLAVNHMGTNFILLSLKAKCLYQREKDKQERETTQLHEYDIIKESV